MNLCPRKAVWEKIEEFFKKGEEPARTKEDLVIVTGKPRVSTGMFPSRTSTHSIHAKFTKKHLFS